MLLDLGARLELTPAENGMRWRRRPRHELLETIPAR